MVDRYTDLLGGNQTFAQVATSLLQDQRSKNKKDRRRQKQALIAGALLSAFDYNKLNKVAQNLDQAAVDKQFDIANKAQEWEAYSAYVQDDKQYKLAGGKQKSIIDAEGKEQAVINPYFKSKATLVFNELNPNFDTQYAGRSDRLSSRQVEIERVAKMMEKQHLEKSNILNLQPAAYNLDPEQYEKYKKIIPSQTNYLTKEEFYKPYNDYYRNKEKRIVDPSERSAVHALFGLFGPSRKRKENLDIKIAQEEEIINTLNNQYEQVSSLIDPLTVSYTNPDRFKYKQGEAILYAMDEKNIPQEFLRKNIIRNLQRSEYEDGVSQSQLQSIIITASVGFDELVAKRTQAQDEFKVKYQQEFAVGDQQATLPFDTDPKTGKRFVKAGFEDAYSQYVSLENVFIDTELGIGTEKSRALREATVKLEIERKKPVPDRDLILYYQGVIADASQSDISLTATREITDILADKSRTTALLTRYQDHLDREGKTDGPDGATLEGARLWWIDTYLTNYLAIQEKIKDKAIIPTTTN